MCWDRPDSPLTSHQCEVSSRALTSDIGSTYLSMAERTTQYTASTYWDHGRRRCVTGSCPTNFRWRVTCDRAVGTASQAAAISQGRGSAGSTDSVEVHGWTDAVSRCTTEVTVDRRLSFNDHATSCAATFERPATFVISDTVQPYRQSTWPGA